MIYYQYVFKCDAKGCSSIMTTSLSKTRVGEILFRPRMYDGWTSVNDFLFCDKHKVEMLIDGEAELQVSR